MTNQIDTTNRKTSKYDSLEQMKSEEYREVLRAIRDVLNDVNQINMSSIAAQEWMAEHIIWRLWALKNDSKNVPV